jgi:hypothetical protein
MPDVNKPIEVSGTTLPTVLATVLRYLVTTFGAFAVGRGWVEAENVEGIVTILVTVATAAYGIWKTRKAKNELIVTAEAAPNSVARVTPK